MTPPPRTLETRLRDTLHRLEHDIDAWIATAGPDGGAPYLIPLSFLWDGRALLLGTASASVTGRNLLATGTVRIGIGLVRDVVLIEGTVEAVPAADLPAAEADAFAAKAGFDPRQSTAPYHYFRVTPRRIQAWREENELAGRDLMRNGIWLVPGA